MMAQYEKLKELLRQDRFEHLVAAWHAASRYEFHHSRALFQQRLVAMGAYIDDWGEWRIETRPMKPIDQEQPPEVDQPLF
jgi:hypothetical protein